MTRKRNCKALWPLSNVLGGFEKLWCFSQLKLTVELALNR